MSNLPMHSTTYRQTSTTGRTLVYTFDPTRTKHPLGPITKHLVIPSGVPGGAPFRVRLPALYANRLWQREQEDLNEEIGDVDATEEELLGLEEDDEETFRLLHEEGDVYLDLDSDEEGGIKVVEGSGEGKPPMAPEDEKDGDGYEENWCDYCSTSTEASDDEPTCSWNGETLLGDISQVEPQINIGGYPDDESTIGPTIDRHVLRVGPSCTRLYLHELSAFAAQLQSGIGPTELLSVYPLHINVPLGPSMHQTVVDRRNGIKAVYGNCIDELSISARVIQMVEWRRPEELLNGISNMSGIHAGSEVLVPEISGGVVQNLTAQSVSVLAHNISKKHAPAQRSSKYIASFAPASHAGLFGWMRFASLSVDHLIIRVLGAELWMPYHFPEPFAGYKALPLIALLASVIATKPCRGMSAITLAGMGPFTNVLSEMWEGVPECTPITGVNPLLDLLVRYPFAKRMAALGEMFLDGDERVDVKTREGNLFGLRTEIQWQAMIMNARHSRNAPKWEFHVCGWEKHVPSSSSSSGG
ncbi:hypothetical protein K505DRAFT_396308 [Melanomma pulvis-pyrius CBS 109.77]|uniref:Uncharacterized protein n=1 Tax=Melanomma pulvis-pyrius CBS 109.77 TaxID=1314802 RepID=A0A6A6XN81_9PLEO|nr:hypothetical protein K505DRAFT_396308 [Melanomma pulvis-pyrius CBS 109.77]